MAMFTRCSHCQAVFRVRLEQLQASSGRVRCGVCGQVFDAFTSLSAADPRGASGAAAPDGRGARTPAPASAPERPLPVLGSVSETVPAALPGPAMASAGAPASLGGRVPGEGDGAPRTRDAMHRPARTGTDEARPDTGPMGPRSDRMHAAYTVLVGVLVVALAMQFIYFARGRLAAWSPGLRPWLEAACRALGCEVPLPRLPERLSIETSDLQALDPARPNRVVLVATIRNRAPVAQAYPMLELTLTDAREQVAARRVFTPDEYLDGTDAAAGLPANAELDIRLRLDTTTLRAAGYRLYLFHP